MTLFESQPCQIISIFGLGYRREKRGVGDTYQTLEESFARCSAARHDVPDLILQLCELQPLLDFGGRHCCMPLSSALSLGIVVGSNHPLPPGISCLLAKTSSNASFISRSSMIRCSSCLASSIRARSFESMTKMRPWVPAYHINSGQLYSV